MNSAQMPDAVEPRGSSRRPNASDILRLLMGEPRQQMADGGAVKGSFKWFLEQGLDPRTGEALQGAYQFSPAVRQQGMPMPAIGVQEDAPLVSMGKRGKGVSHALGTVRINPAAIMPMVEGAFQAGRDLLGGYADGGTLVDGPGTGRSDDVPATMDAFADTRLSRGEYVIPADVVSAMGEGSTDAGAEALNRLVDKTRAKWRKRTATFPSPGDR